MEEAPLISFIIPIYNVPGEMFCKCIDSILALSLRGCEREIIVVDDGSKKNLIGEAAEFIDDIIYIRQKNGGVAAARNLGLRMASGRFIQFVDGDDMILPIYEHVIDLLRFETTDLVMFDFANKCQNHIEYSDEGPFTGAELMRRSNIHGSAWGFVFESNILGSLRFTPGIAYGEDEEFTAQLLIRAERVFRTTAKAYFYRPRPSSAIKDASIKGRLRRLHDTKSVILHLHSLKDSLTHVDRIAMKRRTAQLTMDYIYNIIVLTRSRRYLDRELDALRKHGLFPLPDLNCTTKYNWFRRLSNSKAGLAILMRVLPLMKRER